MKAYPATPWHQTSFDHFVHHALPQLLRKRLHLTGYSVEAESDTTCRIRLQAGAGDSVFGVDYEQIPIPDEDGVFRISGIEVAEAPSAFAPAPRLYAEETELTVSPVADRDDLSEARIECVGERLLAFIDARLGQIPSDVELDAAILKPLVPLDAWIRAFFTQCAHRLRTTNWLDRATHLRRVLIPNREQVFTPGHYGRVCSFESPEGPNVGKVLTISRGAQIHDGRIVIIDDDPVAGLGLGASCLPFLEHDDGNRVLMGVNMMRQWIPPQQQEAAFVQTGFEPETDDFWAGRNLLTAFVSWDGDTFEDAVVISETAATKLACPLPLVPGDKLSNRHGIKGVISRVLADDLMPQLPDGTPVELITSICGVPSRWVMGELREAAISHVAHNDGTPVIVPPFGSPSGEQLREQIQAAGLPANGMLQLTDAGVPLRRETTVGWVYWGCTVHLAADKMQVAVRPDEPCQKLGPMEIQALREADAGLVIREFINTCSADRTDAETLVERLAGGSLSPAATPSPGFLVVEQRLRAARIGVTLTDNGVEFAFLDDTAQTLKLAHPVAHPWLTDTTLTEISATEPDSQLVIDANQRVLDLQTSGAPEPLLHEARSTLSRAVGQYFDGLLSGADLHFGSRVLFSARSVLIPGPDLSIDQIGIPEEVAWQLFGPQVDGRLSDSAAVAQKTAQASQLLDEVMADAWIVLHRAPTVSRTSLIAFHPVRRPTHAIHLHPLACGLLDADFDGDQAALFLPLTAAAATEARDRLSITAHLRSDPTLIEDLRPAMDSIFGLACLSRSAEGRKQISQIVGASLAPSGSGLWDKGSVTKTLRAILDDQGPEAALDASQKLMVLGFEAARREGASIGPFVGETLQLPPAPVTDEFEHWQAWQEEQYGVIDRFDDFDDPDVGALILLKESGARANVHQVSALLAAGGPVHDVQGDIWPVRGCWRDGMSAKEALTRVVGARRGLFNIRAQIEALEQDHAVRSRPQGYGVIARAGRCSRPGIVFARAASSSEIDPLTDDTSRLFVGLP